MTPRRLTITPDPTPRALHGIPLDIKDAFDYNADPESVVQFAESLQVKHREILQFINVRLRTFQSYRTEHKPLDRDASLNLMRIARITNAAQEFFGDEQTAREWLTTPRDSLSGGGSPRSPLEFALLPGGEEFLRNHLLQLRHGISP
jgi:putative toxin-antitoxin system antitoxin component (TIGR02293 family)